MSTEKMILLGILGYIAYQHLKSQPTHFVGGGSPSILNVLPDLTTNTGLNCPSGTTLFVTYDPQGDQFYQSCELNPSTNNI